MCTLCHFVFHANHQSKINSLSSCGELCNRKRHNICNCNLRILTQRSILNLEPVIHNLILYSDATLLKGGAERSLRLAHVFKLCINSLHQRVGRLYNRQQSRRTFLPSTVLSMTLCKTIVRVQKILFNSRTLVLYAFLSLYNLISTFLYPKVSTKQLKCIPRLTDRKRSNPRVASAVFNPMRCLLRARLDLLFVAEPSVEGCADILQVKTSNSKQEVSNRK